MDLRGSHGSVVTELGIFLLCQVIYSICIVINLLRTTGALC